MADDLIVEAADLLRTTRFSETGRVLRAVANQGDDAVLALLEMARDDNGRKLVLGALAESSGGSGIPALRQLVVEETTSKDVREQAIRALARRSGGEAAETLLSALAGKGSPVSRDESAIALCAVTTGEYVAELTDYLRRRLRGRKATPPESDDNVSVVNWVTLYQKCYSETGNFERASASGHILFSRTEADFMQRLASLPSDIAEQLLEEWRTQFLSSPIEALSEMQG